MVVCVVVNWNGWRDTIACLDTLKHQAAQPLHVVVVDNGSTNDSVERIEEFIAAAEGTCPTRFQLVRGSANVGFACGANIGIRAGLQLNPEFVWLLNNDTECPADTLEKLLRTAGEHPEAGAVGTVLYYHHNPAQVQAWSGGRISRWTGTATHYYAPTRQVRGSYVTFASALIRTAVLRELWLLYQGFFMYYDDSDFCMRMEKTRWKIAVAEDTAVLHKESASTEGPRNPFMERTIAVSGMRFLKRHSPLPAFSIPALVLLKLSNRARRGEWAACLAVLQAVREYRAGKSPWATGLPSETDLG